MIKSKYIDGNNFKDKKPFVVPKLKINFGFYSLYVTYIFSLIVYR